MIYQYQEPTPLRMLIPLSDHDVVAEEERIASLLMDKCPLQAFNPRDEANFDTKFWAGFNDREYYLYENQVYADNEINYFGIGMYENWAGDSLDVADLITWLWKKSQYNGTPTPNTYAWLEKGYDDYPPIARYLKLKQASQSNSQQNRR